MTCREKLAMEHPEDLGKWWPGGCFGCPEDRGYLKNPEDCDGDGDEERCRKCWDREIPIEGVEDIGCTGEPGESGVPRILDSGNRRQFASGAVRDIQEGKGRCDLLPLDVVAECYKHAFGDEDECYGILNGIANFVDTGDVWYLHEALDVACPYDSYSTMVLEVAKHFEEGAKKYGENNWRKGIPVHCYIDSAIRHFLKFLRGDQDEPHDRAFCWNIMCAIWTCKHHPELNEYKKENCDETV